MYKWLAVVEEQGNFTTLIVNADSFHEAKELAEDTYMTSTQHSDAGADLFSLTRLTTKD